MTLNEDLHRAILSLKRRWPRWAIERAGFAELVDAEPEDSQPNDVSSST